MEPLWRGRYGRRRILEIETDGWRWKEARGEGYYAAFFNRYAGIFVSGKILTSMFLEIDFACVGGLSNGVDYTLENHTYQLGWHLS